MIKLVFCARRSPHLSLGEFQRYWRDTHGPLVRRHAQALRLRRYVQVHRLDDPLNDLLRQSRGGPEPYDGVAELWWDSKEDFLAAMNSEEGRRASMELLEDELRFLDLRNCPVWINEEHPIVDRA